MDAIIGEIFQVAKAHGFALKGERGAGQAVTFRSEEGLLIGRGAVGSRA